MGFASLAAGVIAVLASIVPLTGPALAFLPFVASVGLGVVALRRQRQPRAAKAGLVLCGVALVLALVVMPAVVQR